MTGTGAFIALVEAALNFFGISIGDGVVAQAINGLLTFLSLLFVVWGQLRRKDLTFGILRKNP